MRDEGMRRFWNERADENSLYFVDNRLDYRAPDEEEFWRRGLEDLEALLKTAGVSVEASAVVVEIGCGVGRLTRGLAQSAREVVAVDVSERMIDQARRRNPHLQNVRWQLGDGRTLAEVPDASADACVSHVVFQHLPHRELTLGYVREMGRVLRAGGWAAFQVSDDPHVHRRRGGLRQAAARLLRRGPRGQSDAAWLGSPTDLNELRATAQDSGMEVEGVRGEGTQFCVVTLRRRDS